MRPSGRPGNAGGAGATGAAGPGGGEGDGPRVTVRTLAPEPAAARQARMVVAEALRGWPDDAVERARLLVSELVTNAVLHARTEITLRVLREEARARFEVGDRRRGGPVPKRYVADSPTGRGMRLVATLAEAWGVERPPGCKVVWFSLARDLPPSATPVGSDPLAPADLELLAAALGEPAVPGDGTGSPTVRVRIVGLPLEVYLEAEQHNDALIRELDLVERSARRGTRVPPRLVELGSGLRTFFAATTTSTRAQVEEALRSDRTRVDLDIEVPSEGWQVLMEMAQQLDEVDRFCQEGALLTLAESPRQRRFRHWYAQQVAIQMQGGVATPWPEDEGD